MALTEQIWIFLTILPCTIISRGIMQEPENPYSHQFLYVSDTSKSVTEDFKEKNGPTSFYYLFTGDSQYWFKCTPTNHECLQATSYCNDRTRDCQVKQNDYANRVQDISIRALISEMAGKAIRPRGLVINGDLTNYGHDEELAKYVSDWTVRLQGIPVYPGLGNHDYMMNVGDCALNHCAERMLDWYAKYVPQQLHRPIDVRQERSYFLYSKYVGSLAYSWDECVQSNSGDIRCIHFIQLNNYPGYTTNFKTLLSDWTVESCFEWLSQDLAQNHNRPIIINFHDFDTNFSDESKSRLRSVIARNNSKVLGMFFAHYHSKVGLHPDKNWCINGHVIPLFYSGSIPGNNYLMVRIDPWNFDKMEGVYVFHVTGDRTTVAKEIHLPDSC